MIKFEIDIRDILIYKFMYARIRNEWVTKTYTQNGIIIPNEAGSRMPAYQILLVEGAPDIHKYNLLLLCSCP